MNTKPLQVVGIVSKCSETTDADVQLAVIRALLTITTAEHFRAHGDCLVQVPVDSHSDCATEIHCPAMRKRCAYGLQQGDRRRRQGSPAHHAKREHCVCSRKLDCCLETQAIRSVFNVAIGADSGDIQRTARNALLQMLNTVLKHVTLYPLVRML